MAGNVDFSQLQSLFRIEISPQIQASLQMEAADLLGKEKGIAFLRKVGTDLQSPSLIVSASIFFKRYLALLSGGLYSMTHHSFALDLSLSNITLASDENWKMASFWLKQAEGLGDAPEDRPTWRSQAVSHFFREMLAPLINTLSEQTGINSNILWAHTAFIVQYYYELWISQAESEEMRDRIAEDFRFLVEEADPSLFGVLDKNPLQIDFSVVPHPVEPDHPIRIRKQCCLAYRLEGGKCCYTCPMLTEQKRTEQILAVGV